MPWVATLLGRIVLLYPSLSTESQFKTFHSAVSENVKAPSDLP